MMLLKKTVYDKLVAKVNNIDTSDFVLKTKYSTDKAELEKKIPNVTDFVIVAKLTELGKKIPYVSNLATKTALTAAENKMPTVNNLVKKTDYNTKISDPEKKFPDHNHNKYITTPEFNKLAADAFNARLAQANLITKTDIDAKLSSLNRKITKNKSKHLLVENEFKKLKSFDLSYFIGKNYFENDGTQNYLVFQPINKYLIFNPSTGLVSEWKSKGLSDKIFKPPDTSLARTPGFKGDGERYLIFNGDCLKQDCSKKVIYDHEKIVSIYIVYDLQSNPNYNPGFTLENCLFGAVKVTKNADVNKYKHSGYGIGFDGK